MIIRLFTFLEASQSRNCKLHLSSANELMKDFVNTDSIKYRRMWAVEEHADIWDIFMDGQFSVHVKEIPFVAIGIDHVEIKSQGGIIGITRNNNSRLRHFLITLVVSTIYQEMYDMEDASIGSGKNEKHHQLGNA